MIGRFANTIAMLAVVLLTLACQAKSLRLDSQALSGESQAFKPQVNYLSLELPFAPYEQLRSQLENNLGHTLKNRGEAHVTVVTPPEVSKLASQMSIAEINRIALDLKIQSAKFEPVCVGEGRLTINGKVDRTFFVVVRSPDLLAIRQTIATEYRARGGEPRAFDADKFYPHVTLGFSERDLHLEQGVVKDSSSCAYQLQVN